MGRPAASQRAPSIRPRPQTSGTSRRTTGEDRINGQLFIHLFNGYFRKYNIGYRFNRGIDLDWIQHDIGFILYPLSLKAKKWIHVADLSKELLHPMVYEKLCHQLEGQQFMDEADAMTRYFVLPLHNWGLLEVKWSDDTHYPRPERIRLSPLFGKFFCFNEQME